MAYRPEKPTYDTMVLLEELEWMAESGESLELVSQRFNYQLDSMYELLRMYGREDIWRRFGGYKKVY